MKEYNVTVDEEGTICWYNQEGQLHREDGPAMEHAYGTKRWFNNGQLHRTDGPAIEFAGGGSRWYINDRLHREDAPAIEYDDGYKEWFLNGIELSDEEFNERTKTVELTLEEIANKFEIDVNNLKIKK